MPNTRVLLVDDEPGFRLLTRILLEEEARVEVAGEAADGPQAIREAKRLRPDAVLLDLNMPGMGGLEALPRIKAASPASRVIVLSVAYDQANLHRAKMAGADAFIDKALGNDEFLRAFRECLAARGAWAVFHRGEDLPPAPGSKPPAGTGSGSGAGLA